MKATRILFWVMMLGIVILSLNPNGEQPFKILVSAIFAIALTGMLWQRARGRKQ